MSIRVYSCIPYIYGDDLSSESPLLVKALRDEERGCHADASRPHIVKLMRAMIRLFRTYNRTSFQLVAIPVLPELSNQPRARCGDGLDLSASGYLRAIKHTKSIHCRKVCPRRPPSEPLQRLAARLRTYAAPPRPEKRPARQRPGGGNLHPDSAQK